MELVIPLELGPPASPCGLRNGKLFGWLSYMEWDRELIASTAEQIRDPVAD